MDTILELQQSLLCQIVTPVGMLGYGFEMDDVHRGLQLSLQANVPTAVILDSGSTDGGPSKLALGEMTAPRSSYYRDLQKLIQVVQSFRVSLIIGSAGGDGSDAHVREILSIIEEILTSSSER